MEEFVTIEDVAKHFKVSVSTIRAWVRKGLIPDNTYVQIGSVYRFRLNDVVSSLLNKSVNDVHVPSAESDVPLEDLWDAAGADEDM